MTFDLLLGTDLTEGTEGNLWLVENMLMFIWWDPAAIFACIFMNALFTSADTDNQIPMALIHTIEK